MADITIYMKPTCPYCVRVIDLLKNQKGQKPTLIDITGNETLKAEMMQKANGRHTVPQVFINKKHIGGCDDTVALQQSGGLDRLLSA